jgi:phospholipid/cholesterol/gamma-HCH transport system substrate-binding protein
MVSKEQKVRVGLFFLIGILLVSALFFISLGRALFTPKKTYHIKFENTSVSGLDVGGNVRYQGINVGEIQRIEVSREDIGNIIVTIRVDEETPIKEDMKANLAMMGITGLKQIELTGGTNQAKDLPEGAYIKTGTSAIANITGEAQIIADKLELLLNNLNNFADLDNQQAVSDILANTSYILEKNRDAISVTIDHSARVSANLEKATEELAVSAAYLREFIEAGKVDMIFENMVRVSESTEQLVQDFSKNIRPERLDTITANIAEFTAMLKSEDTGGLIQKTSEVLVELKSILRQTDKTTQLIDMTVLKSSRDIVEAIETLNDTLENLNEFSRIISEEPSRLIEF